MKFSTTTFLVFTIGSVLADSGLAAPDTANKVVVANLDRYDAVLRIGTTRREIKPRKASVLSPKSYPFEIEFWSGNTVAGWRKQTISRPGIYGLNFRHGSWRLNQLKQGTTTRYARRPSPRVVRQKIISQPVRRLPINVDRNRWSPLARAAYAAGKIYQFVRDEEDRELLRELLIRAREDEDWDRLERWLDENPIPELYKHDLRDAFEDLARLSDEDWKEIGTSDEKDWDQARSDLGELISNSEWDNVVGDFAEIDSDDYWKDDMEVDLGDLDYADNLDFEDVDLGDLDAGYGFDVDGLDYGEDYDVDEFEIDAGHYDLEDYDDFGGYDGAYDVDVGDYGGGYWGDDDFGDFGGFDDFGGDDW